MKNIKSKESGPEQIVNEGDRVLLVDFSGWFTVDAKMQNSFVLEAKRKNLSTVNNG